MKQSSSEYCGAAPPLVASFDRLFGVVPQGSFAEGTFAAYVPGEREVEECDVPEDD